MDNPGYGQPGYGQPGYADPAGAQAQAYPTAQYAPYGQPALTASSRRHRSRPRHACNATALGRHVPATGTESSAPAVDGRPHTR